MPSSDRSDHRAITILWRPRRRPTELLLRVTNLPRDAPQPFCQERWRFNSSATDCHILPASSVALLPNISSAQQPLKRVRDAHV
jgi:hypothetical protein